MWSSDSRSFTYDGGIGGQRYIFSADGSNQTLIPGTSPTWLPDGKKIAFASYSDNYSEIYIMRIDGTDKTLLTKNPHISSLAWSPDGAKIAFASWHDYYGEIYVMSTDGRNQRLISFSKLPCVYSDLLWSPDSSKIVFSFRFLEGAEKDWESMIKSCGSVGIGVIRNVDVADGGTMFQGNSPAWSPDSTKFAFVDEGKIYVIYNKTQLADGWAPVWSPNGKKIAFESNRDGNDAIYVMNSDGTNQKKLADGWAPAWSPR